MTSDTDPLREEVRLRYAESARAVVELKTKGIENAGALLGGFAAWQNAGLPVDTKDTKTANP